MPCHQSDSGFRVQTPHWQRLTTGLAGAAAGVPPAVLPWDAGPAGVLLSPSGRFSPAASDMANDAPQPRHAAWQHWQTDISAGCNIR